jgi:hypothetical protein
MVPANMADELRCVAMVRKGDAAIGAFAKMAAGFAEHCGGKASAVQEEDCLLAIAQAFLNAIQKSGRANRLTA